MDDWEKQEENFTGFGAAHPVVVSVKNGWKYPPVYAILSSTELLRNKKLYPSAGAPLEGSRNSSMLRDLSQEL